MGGLVGVIQSPVGMLQVPKVLVIEPLPLETLAIEIMSRKLSGKIWVREYLFLKVRSILEWKTLSWKLLARKWLAKGLSRKLLTHILSLSWQKFGGSIQNLVVAVNALKLI